jgi:hypothetical protein
MTPIVSVWWEPIVLETRPNSRVITIDKNHWSNCTGKPFQIYCRNGKENTKGAIPVLLWYNVWHRLSSKDKDLILKEPIIKVHNYNVEEVLSVWGLKEALETSAQQHVEDALQAVENKEWHEQIDDES